MKKEVTTKNVNAARNKETILKLIRKGETVTPANAAEQENIEFANLVITAEKFVEDYRTKNGTKAYIAERLRSGYIGELVHCDNGASYIQSVRGKPYGTVVAIPTKDNVVIGMSYMDNDDKNTGHPIIGLYIALKRAIEDLEKGKIGAEKKFVKSKARKQIIHFEKRAKAYFHPDVFSHSRGSNPVVYENYEEIHQRRAKILGEGK